jgi:hypothetical protein
MIIAITVIHRGLTAYTDRQDVVNSLRQYANVEIVSTLSDPPKFAHCPDCLIVHGSQDDDVSLAETHCAEGSDGARLVIFGGGISTPSLLDGFGCMVSDKTFISNGLYFFREWARQDKFPGWDYLIGEPELEYALEVLHCLLPNAYGEQQDEPVNEWNALKNFKEQCGETNKANEVEQLWNTAQAKYDDFIQRGPSDDPIKLLAELRDALLGADEIESGGLVALMSQLRKS